jgi:hypothetical protein
MMVVAVMIAVAVAGAGCASASAVTSAPEPASLREMLGTPTQFELQPQQSTVQLEASIDRGDLALASHLTLPIDGGHAEVVAVGDQLEISTLDLELSPVEVPTTIVSGGIRLTGVRLGLPQPAYIGDAVWVDDDDVTATTKLALDLDWSLDLGGNTWPLATQRLPDFETTIAIGRNGDAVTLDVVTTASGVQWSWADIVAFGDVTIEVHAAVP